MPVEHGVRLRCLDQFARIGGELPFDPARLAAPFLGFLTRPRNEREQQRGFLPAPRFVIDGEKCPVQLLEHVGDALVALVSAPDVRLANPVRPIFPSIAAGREDHQRQQSGCRETE